MKARLNRDRSMVMVEVEDTGLGIPQRNLAEVWGAFKQVGQVPVLVNR